MACVRRAAWFVSIELDFSHKPLMLADVMGCFRNHKLAVSIMPYDKNTYRMASIHHVMQSMCWIHGFNMCFVTMYIVIACISPVSNSYKATHFGTRLVQGCWYPDLHSVRIWPCLALCSVAPYEWWVVSRRKDRSVPRCASGNICFEAISMANLKTYPRQVRFVTTFSSLNGELFVLLGILGGDSLAF